MKVSTKAKLLGGAVGLGALAVGAWTAVDMAANRGVNRVPYTTVGEIDGVELRRYPETVRVRTTARSQGQAFRRLFRYIDGANDGGESVAMTAPVETEDDDADEGESIEMTAPVETERGERSGAEVAMTAPVETEESEGGVTMSFFLPESYTPETAPEPTDPTVELVVAEPRTMAVLTFSWWTPDLRVRLKERELLRTLDDAGIEAVGDPVLERYDAPFTPPFRRTNEVAVEVTSESVRRALRRE